MVETSRTVKTSQNGGLVPDSSSQLIFTCLEISVVSSVTGSYHLVLNANQKQWQGPVKFAEGFRDLHLPKQ